MAALIYLTLLAVSVAWLAPTGAGIAARSNPAVPSNETLETNSVYLPLVSRGYNTVPVFGVEIEALYINDPAIQQKAAETQAQWLRSPIFSWKDIEPDYFETPVYHWEVLDDYYMQSLGSYNFNIIATVKYTPSWAQKFPPSTYCGPVAQDNLDEFARFMSALVTRYSSAPYNIHYWEIGNEPDVDPSIVSGSSHYGCWGDKNDPYYGGGYYADMLKQVYPAIKAADPQAKVIIGGLLLDCDPTHPPSNRTCEPAYFLEGILRNQGADYFDIVSFHGYAGYYTIITDEVYNDWAHRGGIVLGKADYLRTVMASYGVDKPILHSEGALFCHPAYAKCNPPVPEFYESQADYVVWLFVRSWAAGLMGSVWFTVEGPGWRYTNLLEYTLDPKPAYYAYQFITQELLGAMYQQQIATYPGLRVYEFTKPGSGGSQPARIWVVWAPDETTHTMTLPAGVQQIFDKYGNTIVPGGGQLDIKSPVYIELTP